MDQEMMIKLTKEECDNLIKWRSIDSYMTEVNDLKEEIKQLRKILNSKIDKEFSRQQRVISLVKSDAYALTFQSMGHYRTRLIEQIRNIFNMD